MIGWSCGVRHTISSLERSILKDWFRKVERQLYYYLPRDASADDKRQLTAASAPKRLVYVPAVDNLELLAQICYRPTDTVGRTGSYFVHFRSTCSPTSAAATVATQALLDTLVRRGYDTVDRANRAEAGKMETKTVDPYYEWLGIPPKDQPPNHYRLLGLELFEENRNVIDAAANRQMSFIKEYQAGADSALSQKLLNQLSAARICLLSPATKTAYDCGQGHCRVAGRPRQGRGGAGLGRSPKIGVRGHGQAGHVAVERTDATADGRSERKSPPAASTEQGNRALNENREDGITTRSWGVAPGYGGSRPSAKGVTPTCTTSKSVREGNLNTNQYQGDQPCHVPVTISLPRSC